LGYNVEPEHFEHRDIHTMTSNPFPNARPYPLRAFIVGGGVMALAAATELLTLTRRLGVPLTVRLFEAGAFGGGPGDRTASARCQLWLHTQGTLYAVTQPSVSIALQRSTARLRQLAPEAFTRPVAFALQKAGATPAAEECFRVLGIQHRAVSPELFHRWLPTVRLGDRFNIWRVRDGTIDLRLLSLALTRHARHARQAGAELIHRRVERLDVHADRVRSLLLDTGERLLVGPDDIVILACGANLRPLLASTGLNVPGLRVFRSHLVATAAFGLPALLAVLDGGVNCVPHVQIDGQALNLFGNSARCELPPESDQLPLCDDPAAVELLCREVEETFGLHMPPGDRLAWPAVKTELVPAGTHSQAHHARLVPGLVNTWMALPGKLSQSAACAADLAGRILREHGHDVARSYWERPPKPDVEGVLPG
jgi:hypothetical protein